MRFYALALLTGAAVLGACGGGEKAKDSTAAATSATTPPPATGTAPASTVAAKPATGATHEIKMIGDDKGYRFDPANITIKAGDAVKFIMVTGGPHNVAFDTDSIPAGTSAQLDANMPATPGDKMGALSSPMLMNPNDSYTISFAGVAPGRYEFHCTPHLAMNMRGSVTVQ